MKKVRFSAFMKHNMMPHNKIVCINHNKTFAFDSRESFLMAAIWQHDTGLTEG
jgi:hypothetical protein